MKPVLLNSYEAFLEHITFDERAMVLLLDPIIQECIPNVVRKQSYNVPYYSQKRRICFIWPSSVPWGKVKMKGVLFGFCQGNKLSDDLNFLDQDQRKQVYTKTYFSLSEIENDEAILKTFLFEAHALDKTKA